MFQKRLSAALDFGSDVIKFVAVDSDSRRIRQLHRLQLGSVHTENEAIIARVRPWLAELAREHGPLPRTISTAVQGTDMFCQYLEFPGLTPKELELAVPSVARKSIPFPMETVALSFVQVPQATPGPRRAAVFAVAARRPRVDRVRVLAQGVGLDLARVDITPLSLAREFGRNHSLPKEEFHALLHVGHSHSQLIVMRDGYPYYVRQMDIGGARFTRQVQMHMQCSWDEAEIFKRRNVASNRDPALEPMLLRWVAELRRTLQHYRRQFPWETHEVREIFVSGGAAAWRGLDQRLSQDLDIPVTIDSWNRVKLATGIPFDHPGTYKAAVGLTLED